MKKKITLLAVCSLVAAFMLSGCGNSGSNDKTSDAGSAAGTAGDVAKVVWANYGSSKMPIAAADQKAIDYMEGTGLFDVDYQPDGVLGGEADMIQQLMDGTIQATILSSATFSSYTSLLDCIQLPFLIGDYEMERTALESDEAKALYQGIEDELGITIVGYAENGIRDFATKSKPITSVADLKGMKIRVVPSNMLTEVMTNLGAAPMTVAYSEVYSALQNNVIDGEEINITSIYAMSHYEQLSYISEIGMYPFPSFVCVNTEFWNSLSEEQQQAWLEGEKIAQDYEFETALPDYEAEARKACEDAGVQFNTISDDKRQEFVDIAKKTWDTYRAQDERIAAFIDYVSGL